MNSEDAKSDSSQTRDSATGKRSTVKFSEDSRSHEDAPIDKVREILFGHKMKEHENFIRDAQKRTESALADSRSELLKRLDTIESYFKQELKSNFERLRAEREQLVKVQEAANADMAQLRQTLLGGIKELSDGLHEKQRKFADSFSRDLDILNQRKTDRAQISELLSECALRINQSGEASSERSH